MSGGAGRQVIPSPLLHPKPLDVIPSECDLGPSNMKLRSPKRSGCLRGIREIRSQKKPQLWATDFADFTEKNQGKDGRADRYCLAEIRGTRTPPF